jgi:DNA polymerase III alpha subunit
MRLATQQSTDQMVAIHQIALYQEHLIVIVPGDEHELVRFLRDAREDIANTSLHQLQQAFSTLYIGLDQQTTAMRQAFSSIVSWLKNHQAQMVALHRTNFLEKEDFPVYTTLRAIDLGVTSYLNIEKEAAMYFPSMRISMYCIVIIQS